MGVVTGHMPVSSNLQDMCWRWRKLSSNFNVYKNLIKEFSYKRDLSARMKKKTFIEFIELWMMLNVSSLGAQ